MSSDNFYNILGINADSLPEDIRKAYKKRALQTHPDRLPQGATPDDKRYAEEQFRKVNNAYEILSDSNKRRLYDLYGTWPPPEDLANSRRASSHDGNYGDPRAHPPYAFHGPFFQPFFHSSPHNGFRDPFDIFNSFFADFNHDPFSGFPSFPSTFSSSFNRPSLFESSMFHPMMQSPFLSDPFNARPSVAMSFGNLPVDSNTRVYSFQTSSRGYASPGSNGTRWISESTSTRTVNGVTETIQKKLDEQGNEHVTRIHHDGQQTYSINGVEQPIRGNIRNTTTVGQLPPPPDDAGYIPPPQASSSQEDNRSKKHWWNRPSQ